MSTSTLGNPILGPLISNPPRIFGAFISISNFGPPIVGPFISNPPPIFGPLTLEKVQKMI